MATSCVPMYRCGTDITGWMNGAHPTVAEGKVTRIVCYNYYGYYGYYGYYRYYGYYGYCCYRSNNIEVVNCGQYYVYKLSPPSGGCNLRYCGSDN